MANTGRPRIMKSLRLRLSAAAALTVLAATPALAEENGQDVPAGSFIIQRDVDTRPAEVPGVPGKPDYVVLGGKDSVLGALGVTPMSDLEQSQVTADVPRQQNVISDTISASLDSFTSNRGAAQSSLGSEHGSFVGGTISGAMSAIPQAMGALQSALGSGQ